MQFSIEVRGTSIGAYSSNTCTGTGRAHPPAATPGAFAQNGGWIAVALFRCLGDQLRCSWLVVPVYRNSPKDRKTTY